MLPRTDVLNGIFSSDQIQRYIKVAQLDHGKPVRLELFKNCNQRVVMEIYSRDRDKDEIMCRVPVQRIVI